jgi:hypothetical protein
LTVSTLQVSSTQSWAMLVAPPEPPPSLVVLDGVVVLDDGVVVLDEESCEVDVPDEVLVPVVGACVVVVRVVVVCEDAVEVSVALSPSESPDPQADRPTVRNGTAIHVMLRRMICPLLATTPCRDLPPPDRMRTFDASILTNP